jgi:uncharacterized membrane protein YfcA
MSDNVPAPGTRILPTRADGSIREYYRAMNYPAAAFILLIAAFAQGFSGFAFSLISLPLLGLMMPAAKAVPMLSLLGLAINVSVFLSKPGSASPRKYLILFAAGLLFTWPGIALLRVIPDQPVRIVVGMLVLATALLYLAGRRFGSGGGALAQAVTGVVSGILNGLTTFSGPPVILFLAGSDAGRDEFRVNLSLYFLVLNIFTVPMLAAGGLLTADLALECAKLLPAVLAGAVAGSLAASRIDTVLFRRIVLWLLAIVGAVAAAVAAFG